MEPTAIATNELGMHVIVRPVPNSLLLDGTVSEIGTEDVNALMTARRPASLADAIGGPPTPPPPARRAPTAVGRFRRRRQTPV